jgi:hypothetical protein
MQQVNEGTTAYLQVSFLDKTGALQQPTSITYRIDDAATRTPIRGATSVAPASTVEIVLTPSDNAIVSSFARTERHIVTVTGTYGSDDQVVAQFVYEVVNLQAIG